MKKSLLALGLTLSIVLAMATPAFAITTEPNANGDAVTEVTLPGSPEYVAGTNPQTAGQSYNQASMTSKDGTAWATANDDDKVATATDANGADINVWAKVVDSGSKVYKVDLAWGAMKFEYTNTAGSWDPEKHTYTATGGTAAWTATFVDGTNNKVGITNHSNNGINAAFAYAMDGTTKFNDANGVDNVIGNFFDTNAKAVAAALVLKATYTDAAGTVNAAAVADKLAAPITLATADAYNNSVAAATSVAGNQIAGARTDDVFFAFSGTPDAGKGKVLDTFKKVGVITVTVTPNNDLGLNQPAYVAGP